MNDQDSWPEGFKPTAHMLQQQLERFKGLDYFTVLGVDPGASTEIVRRAFFRHMKKWHPSKYALQDEGVRLAVAEIFILLKRAFDTIGDPSKAAAYRSRLPAAVARSVTPATPAAPLNAPAPRASTSTTSAPFPPVPEASNAGSSITRPALLTRPPAVNAATRATGASVSRMAMSPARPTLGHGQPSQPNSANPANRTDVRPPVASPKPPAATTTTRIAPRATTVAENHRVEASGTTTSKAPARPLPGAASPRGAQPTKKAEAVPAVVEPFSEAREIARANNCLVDYNFNQARIHLDRILVITPAHARAKALKRVADGLEAQISGRIDIAKKCYLESLAIDPKCGEASTGLAELETQRTTDFAAKKSKAGLFRKLFFNE